MSDNVNRKACDRCHSQKLSCKRVGDGVCERCLRLNAECKSSPSLRYKRQLQQSDQMQEQKPQQQSQQFEQLEPSHHCYQDQQQQRQQPLPNYQHRQSATCESALSFETQPHIEAQDSTEDRSPKRRRTGSEVHPVQRDAGLPLVATDATLNPGLQGHLMTAPDGSARLAEYAINLRDMNCMAISQPQMPPAYLLGSQVPSGVDDYFNLDQVIPSLWPHQSLPVQVQQPRQHLHLVSQHQQQQPIFDTVSAAPLVVPISAVAHQQQVFSSHYHHPQLHPTHKATSILGSRRRQAAVPTLSYSTFSALPVKERRARSNKVQIRSMDLVIPNSDSLRESRTMHEFSVIWSRLLVLADHLKMLEEGKDYGDGPDGKPNEFTVAELYKYTHVVVDALEQLVAVRSGNNSGGSDGSSDSSSGQGVPIITAGDFVDGMFTMALYAQFLNLMQRLFTHVRKVLAAADPHRDDTFAAWLLPEMNIGAALIDAHPTFHMSLTVQLAVQFLERLRAANTILCVGDSGPAGVNGDATAAESGPHAEMVGIPERSTLARLKARENELGKTLSQLQEELRSFMDTMDAIDAMEEDEKKEN